MRQLRKILISLFLILAFASAAQAKSKYIWDYELEKLPKTQEQFVVDVVKAFRDSNIELATSRLHSSILKNQTCYDVFKKRFKEKTIQEQYAVRVKNGRKKDSLYFSIRDQKKGDGSKRNFFKMKNVVNENGKLVIKMNCKAALKFEKKAKAKKLKSTSKKIDQAKAGSVKTLGKYKMNKTVMPIKDVFFYFKEKESTLVVIQTPSLLTKEEKQKIASGEDEFFVLARKESPNSKIWDWYPYVVTEIRFKSNEINAANVKNFYIVAFGVEKKNHTSNINSFPNDKNIFKKVKIKNGKLSLKYKGQSDLMDNKHKWSLSM